MVLGRNKKKDERKEMRRKAALQDSMNTGGIEQQAVQDKREERKEGSNYLFDVEESRELIEKGLKGKVTRKVRFKDENGDIQEGWQTIDTRQRKLCNDDAAELFLEICNSGGLNHNTISGYMPAKQIKNKFLATMKSVYEQIIFNHHIHGIGYKDTQDASSISSIVRNPVLDAMNKARGGRMIESQEKVRVEKESISREGGENQEDSRSVRDLF